MVKWLLAARQVSFISLPLYTALRQRGRQLTALCGQIGGVGIVSAITEMPPGDAPPRRPRAAYGRRGACSLSSPHVDRVAAVRSVDFAAEEGVVALPSGAPDGRAGRVLLAAVEMSAQLMARKALDLRR